MDVDDAQKEWTTGGNRKRLDGCLSAVDRERVGFIANRSSCESFK
uniref:Uncharacterized protein n=1 Tax=Ditylenchus dipsaci TaxID=166011 RepID=A0A915DG52_9BILA